jgi:tetratricopeptide (TPR) repeat protein
MAVAAVALCARAAAADELDDLMKQGSQAYQNGHYEDAIAKLQQAYALSPKVEILFALAQAERLGGHCPAAVAHYKQVLERMTDLETAKLVQGNVALCEKTEAVVEDKTKPPPDHTAPPPPPPPPPKTIVRVEHDTDYLAVSSLAAGALGLGLATGLYMASGATRDAAAGAPTLDDNHTLNDRADLERGMAYITTAVGVGLVSYAIYRWVRPTHEHPGPLVQLAHTRQGTTTLSFMTRF